MIHILHLVVVVSIKEFGLFKNSCNLTYKNISLDKEAILEYSINTENDLSALYLIPNVHKNQHRERYSASSSTCSTTTKNCL